MKKSNRLLTVTAVLLVVLFSTALIFLKQEAKRVVNQYSIQTGLKKQDVGEFHSLVIGEGFDVSVIGWITTMVSMQTSSNLNPKVENVNGTLYFSMDQDTTQEVQDLITLNIRVEDIESITSMKGSTLQLVALDTDSLSVKLDDSKSLDMVNCKIKHLEITNSDGFTITSSQLEENM